MTCCGEAHSTELMTSGPNCLAIVTAWSSVGAVGRGAGEHDAAVDRRDPQLGMREAAADLGLQQRGVVDHLDVEHADQLLAFGIDRHAGGAVLLAEDRQRVVGQRIDVGDLGIADRDLDEARVGAHVLGLADIDGHRRGALGAADLDRSAAPALRRRQSSRPRSISAGRERARQRRRPAAFCPSVHVHDSPPICF